MKIIDFTKFHFKRAVKFASVGTVGAIINLSVLFILTEQFHLWYMLSEIIAILVALIFNYFVNTYWTYRDAMKALNKNKKCERDDD